MITSWGFGIADFDVETCHGCVSAVALSHYTPRPPIGTKGSAVNQRWQLVGRLLETFLVKFKTVLAKASCTYGVREDSKLRECVVAYAGTLHDKCDMITHYMTSTWHNNQATPAVGHAYKTLKPLNTINN